MLKMLILAKLMVIRNMKRKLSNAVLAAAAFSLALLMTSCSSTSLVSSWLAPKTQDGFMDKVLVFSLMGNQDHAVQDEFEDAVVTELSRHDVDAVSAYDLFGPYGLKNKDAAYISEKVKEAGFTDIMLITLLDKTKYKTYTPGTAVPVSGWRGPWFNPFYGRYEFYYGVVTTPGYYTINTEYLIETTIYGVNAGDDVLYVAQTSTSDPVDSPTMADEVAKTVVHDLVKRGVVAKAEGKQ